MLLPAGYRIPKNQNVLVNIAMWQCNANIYLTDP